MEEESGATVTEQRSGSVDGSPALANIIVKLSGPLVTAADQPPAPDSNWMVRGAWRGRRSGGWVLERLPSSTALWSQILRLTTVLLAWFVMLAVAAYAILIWLFIVLPIRWLSNRRKPSEQHAVLPPPPNGGWHVTTVSHLPPPPPDPRLQVLNALERAPHPDPQPAMDSCPMCGAKTSEKAPTCVYCGVGVPMVVSRGWYTDPLGGTGRRWFDGDQWTEFTRQRAS